MARPPMPLDWHPAYSGHTDLLDWLNDPRGYREYCVARSPDWRALMLAEPGDVLPTDRGLKVHRLTRRKVAAPAPYVGDPVVYVWHYATDELGRAIAGDAMRVPI